MRKSFIAMVLLLTVAAGTLVSCGKDKETKYNAKEQKVKLDQVGEQFINELDLKNWKSTIDIVAPAIELLDTANTKAIRLSIEAEDTTFNAGMSQRTITYTLSFAGIKGHFDIDDKAVAKPEEGEFDDFQIAFDAQGHSYKGVVKITDSKNSVLVRNDSEKTDYYYDENHNRVNVPDSIVLCEQTYLVLPEKFVVDFTADNAKPFSIEAKLDYSGPNDLTVEPDFNEFTVGVNAVVKAGDYSLNLSQLSYKNRNFSEKFSFKRGSKNLLSINSSATELYYSDENTGIEDGINCKKASLSIDVLGQVQAKGSVNYDGLLPAYKAVPEKMADMNDANAWLKTLKPFYDLGIYYNGSESKQAYVELEAVEMSRIDEESGEEIKDGYEILPVIKFNDGTKTVATEFFTPDNFTKTMKAYENLMMKVMSYFQEIGLIEAPEDEEVLK
ncbi:MAG: hypothetical protein K6F58_06675 [Bacteroidales bacterium]|nr:hypothetical protein [Bacteroidales bacterium]